MSTQWYMEGPYFKTCNCDPGCPCDYNQVPTHGSCHGIFGMRIDRGNFGELDLGGLHWVGIIRVPGALHQGNGELQYVVDEAGSEEQRHAILEALSGRHGDTFWQVLDFVCPHKREPAFAPFDYAFDLENRGVRLRVGDLVEMETETLRGIEPPDPYRVITRIPGGMEYVNDTNEAEIAQAKVIRTRGPIAFEIEDGHASLCYVRHGSDVTTVHQPTVVEATA